MGLRLTYSTYREANRDVVIDTLSEVCERLGFSVDLGRDYKLSTLTPVERQRTFEELQARNMAVLHVGFSQKAFTLDVSGLIGGYFTISEAIGIELGCPWFELRIQEGNHWDYSFFKGAAHIDQFSADPWYFGESWWRTRGRAGLIASEWGVPEQSLSRYLKHWRWYRRGRAYPGDKATYRDYEQLYDFLRALDAPSPDDHHYALEALNKKAKN